MKGTIVRRGKSSWRLKYDLAPGPDGKRRTTYETIRTGSKKEAQAALTERLAAISKGTFVEPSKLTVAAHVRSRIEIWHGSGEIGNATRERYAMLLKKQVAHIGEVVLQKLGTKNVEAWHAKLLSAGLSPRTVRHAHVLLRKALGDAVRHGQISRNVCGKDGQPAPTVPKKKTKSLKKGEIADVVKKLRSSDLFPQAMLALFCGLRAGEVLALRWSSIDLDGKVLQVKESVEEIAGRPLAIKQPKTEDSIRRVTLPNIAVDALRAHRRQQLEQRLARGLGKLPDDALVFAALDGGPLRRTALSSRWAEIVDDLGLPDVTFHGLRHSHASQLIREKVDIVTISRRLGHANPSITLKIYAHEFDPTDASAADAINDALGAISVPKTG